MVWGKGQVSLICTVLPPAAPIHFSIPPNWLLNLLSEIGLPVPSTLTNWPPFHPHFPWCLCRIPPQAPVFPAPSLSSLPAHHGPLSSHLRLLYWHLSPPECNSMLTSSLYLLLSITLSPLFLLISLSLSSLSPDVSPPVSWFYILSICQRHPHYTSTSPYIIPELPNSLPKSIPLHVVIQQAAQT